MSRRRQTGTTSHGAVWPAASPRGEGGPDARSSPAPRAGRAPLPGCRWVCPRVSRPPRLRAVPRRSPPAVQLSALPRAAPSAPPERQHRRARGPGSERGAPEARGARRPRPRLFPAAPPLFSCCRSALAPALSSAPRPAALASGRETPPAAPRGLCRRRPRWPPGLCPARVSSASLALTVSLPEPRASPRSPSQSLSPVSLPCASPALARSLPSVSLSFALSLRSPLSRTQAPAASPARPGARAPDARGARRTPNSPHAARLCETFAPPHT